MTILAHTLFLANTGLQELSLGDNHIKNPLPLLAALHNNTNLTRAGFGEQRGASGFTDTLATALSELLKANQTLIELNVMDYRGEWARESFELVAETIKDHNHTILGLRLNPNFRGHEMRGIYEQLGRNWTEKGLTPPKYVSIVEQLGME